MEKLNIGVAVVACLMLVACAPLERSRETANPKTPARTLALQVCSTCHGVDGNATSPNFPNLAGQTEPYLVEQLKSFRAHSRSDPAGFEYMWGLSRNLTDEQIEGLAAYYATQQTRPLAASKSPKLAQLELGRGIFENGIAGKNIPACAGCHGAEGQGNGQFPRLAYQHADYIIKQLLVFQRTDERPEGALMKVVAHDLTREDIAAVAAYIESFPHK